jgi:benzodiazapine receptor
MKNIIQAAMAIVICELAGLLGAVFTTPAIPGWYAGLKKPALNPPSWLFGPVWTMLYALMGVSLYLVWRKREQPGAKLALVVFFLQLALNSAWSMIFFGLKNPGLAFIGIIALWLAIAGAILFFYPLDRRAAWLLLPYLAWVSFAAYLNFSIWRLN